ncbi:MAG: hypothetical protein P1P85_02765 [Patescibacteria group bacterium]|nr:hypothetical protein [Patescibacteria group bacterium]
MENSSNKIVGYVLLFLGLMIIFWGIYFSYLIFTAKKEAPKVFSYTSEGVVNLNKEDIEAVSDEGIIIDKSRLSDPNYLKSLEIQQKGQLEDAIKDQMGNQIKEIIPEEFVLKLLNLSSWSLFIFILVFAGGKISGLGIKLIKN